MSKTQRWLVLATVSAGLLMVSVDTTVLYTALPSDLQADASQKLWIINAYPLAMAGLLLVWMDFHHGFPTAGPLRRRRAIWRSGGKPRPRSCSR